MHKSPSMPSMFDPTNHVQRQPNKALTRSARSASANSLPLLATLAAPEPVGTWDAAVLEEAFPVVPVNNLFKCGPVHTFPLSVMAASSEVDAVKDDARGAALCLASPVVEEEPKRETEEFELLVRRAAYMGNTLSRRRKWAEVMRRKASQT